MKDRIEELLSEHKTLCCNAEWYRKGRADYRCKKCDKSVTMELVFLAQALEEEE